MSETTLETKEQRAEALLEKLSHFHGSDQFFEFNPVICRSIYTTEGGLYLAKAASAFWLLEYIGLRCRSNEFPKIKAEEFQVWKLRVDLEHHTGVISCEDGNYKEVFRDVLEFTSFPLSEIELWCEPNEFGMTIYLPGER